MFVLRKKINSPDLKFFFLVFFLYIRFNNPEKSFVTKFFTRMAIALWKTLRKYISNSNIFISFFYIYYFFFLAVFYYRYNILSTYIFFYSQFFFAVGEEFSCPMVCIGDSYMSLYLYDKIIILIIEMLIFFSFFLFFLVVK